VVSGRGDAAGRGDRTEVYVVSVVAVVVAALAVWRCMFSVGLTDDALYVAMPMRLGEGGRIFFNEMSLQSLGYWVVIPFVKAWKTVIGMNGIVLAVRVFYVFVGGIVALFAYRALRPTFSPAACALAATVPVLAPPYNILGVNYNTSAALPFMLAAALLFASARDGSRTPAIVAGLAVAYAAVSYPPLAPAGLVLLATFAFMTRKKIGPAVAAAVAATAAVALAATLLVAFSSIADVARTLAYLPKNVTMVGTPIDKAGYIAYWTLHSTLLDRYLLPLWVLAIVASIPRVSQRVRSVALLLLPFAAASSGVMRFVNHQNTHWFSSLAAGYLIVFLVAATVPVAVRAMVERRTELLSLLRLAAPFTIVAYLLVTYASSAGWWRGSPVIALGPLALAVVAGWAEDVRRGLGPAGLAVGSLCLLLALFGFLFGTSHDDQPPYRLTTFVGSGPYAGITTTPQRAAQMRDFERKARRWVKPGDKVLVQGGPLGYLFADAPMATNQVWLVPGKTDSETVGYFTRTGDTPDVAFVNRNILTPGSVATDPFVGYLTRNYHVVDIAGSEFVVWVRHP